MSVSILRLKVLPPLPISVGRWYTVLNHSRSSFYRDDVIFRSLTTLSTCDCKVPGWCSRTHYTSRGNLWRTVGSPADLSSQYAIVRSYSSDRKAKGPKVEDGTSDQPQEKVERVGLVQKFKQMYRDYWYVLGPVHVITSFGWYGGFYYLAKSGMDVVTLLESVGLSERFIGPMRDSKAGYLALAYAMYKIATPVRYAVTLGATTFSINYLTKRGYIKPMPRTEKLKELYKEKKGRVIEKRDSLAEDLRLKRERLKEQRVTFMDEYRKRAKKGGVNDKKV